MNYLTKISEFEQFANSGKPPPDTYSIVLSYSKGYNISMNVVFDAYEKYIGWWQSKFGEIEERYVAKVDKPIIFEEFVLKKKYNSVFKHGKSKMDEYLFGDYDMYELEKKVVELNKSMLNET